MVDKDCWPLSDELINNYVPSKATFLIGAFQHSSFGPGVFKHGKSTTKITENAFNLLALHDFWKVVFQWFYFLKNSFYMTTNNAKRQ